MTIVAPSRTGTGAQRVRRALGFAVLASVVPVLWLVRNVTTGDSLAGNRVGRSDSLSELGRRVLVAMGRTVVPNGAPDALTELAAVVLVVAFVGGAVLALGARPPSDDAVGRWPMTPLVVIGFALFERARNQARDVGRDRLAIVVAGAFLAWLARALRHGCAEPSVFAIYSTHTTVPDADAKAGVEVTELRRVDDGTVYRVDCGADGSRVRSAE